MQPSSLEALSSLNWRLDWHALVAWSVAAICGVIAAGRLKKTERLRAPEPKALLAELLAESGAAASNSEAVRHSAIADLNQRLADVSFELSLLPARFTALTRISLASGTALALFGYIGATESAQLDRAFRLVVCALAGLFGAATVLAIGRTAKRRAQVIREGWDRSSRETGKSLGTTLAASSPRSEV